MSSVASAGLAQIPRNSHFRCIPTLMGDAGIVSSAILTFTPTSGVAPVLTNPTGAATGGFTAAPWAAAAGAIYLGATVAPSTPYQLLSSGRGLLKDMGDTIVSAGRTFRRVQLLNPFNITEQMGGTYTGVDSDANAGYIEVGFRGGAVAGPFVRGY